MGIEVSIKSLPKLYPVEGQDVQYIGIFANGDLGPVNEFEKLIKKVEKCQILILADGGANRFFQLKQAHPSLELKARPVCLIGDLDSVTQEVQEFLKQEFPEMRIMKFPRDKDFTDLEGALQIIDIKKVESVFLFSALGKRIDHELGNIQLMHRKEFRGQLVIIGPNDEELRVLPTPFSNSISFFNKPTSKQALHFSGPRELTPPTLDASEMFIELDFEDALLADKIPSIEYLKTHPWPFQLKGKKETLFTIISTQECHFPTQKGQTISLIPLTGPVKNIKTTGLNWNLNTDIFDKKTCGISNIAIEKEVVISVEEGILLCIVNEFIDEEMLSTE
jgi:thiamine pyrophosphokinase